MIKKRATFIKSYICLIVLAVLVAYLCLSPIGPSLSYSYTYSAVNINTFSGAEEPETPDTPENPEEQDKPDETEVPSAGDETESSGTTEGQEKGDTGEGTDAISNTKTDDTGRIYRYIACITACTAVLILIWGRGKGKGNS